MNVVWELVQQMKKDGWEVLSEVRGLPLCKNPEHAAYGTPRASCQEEECVAATVLESLDSEGKDFESGQVRIFSDPIDRALAKSHCGFPAIEPVGVIVLPAPVVAGGVVRFAVHVSPYGRDPGISAPGSP